MRVASLIRFVHLYSKDPVGPSIGRGLEPRGASVNALLMALGDELEAAPDPDAMALVALLRVYLAPAL